MVLMTEHRPSADGPNDGTCLSYFRKVVHTVQVRYRGAGVANKFGAEGR